MNSFIGIDIFSLNSNLSPLSEALINEATSDHEFIKQLQCLIGSCHILVKALDLQPNICSGSWCSVGQCLHSDSPVVKGGPRCLYENTFLFKTAGVRPL